MSYDHTNRNMKKEIWSYNQKSELEDMVIQSEV